ncbi:SRPBCC family protein [Aquimarina litoralis]|uniref:SRPBCC family protein n=1 Tax=Aquimarina litoralis TaxID=584605 RepID=UPI001C57137E|nr:SRPBCC domain-containing protein [Aquimarina litoralis]MBW1295148.1 SRPBCC domain-containing protein [Aquimarina litoralis]
MKTTDNPIVISQTFHSSINKVWNAITNVDEMRLWFFDNIPSFKPEIGFETAFLVEVEDRKFTHCWEVIEVELNRKISYTWSYSEYVGDAIVTFELIKQLNSVILQLSMIVTEDFSSDIPEFKKESCVAGWNYFLKDRLKTYLMES